MPRLKRLLEFFSVVVVYFVLFYCIFDVYYTSPLIKGTPLIPTNTSPLATHLILIVSDGLRADKLFGNHIEDAPFIKNILSHNGSWGLSHTRVPTESRPGHIAIFGGFYEDVASITKGWKKNAVEFDSVLNRSLRAWAWGTAEVVNAFTLPHVYTESSPTNLSEMSRHNIVDIDRWTVNKFLHLLNDNKSGFFSTLHSDNLKLEDIRRGHVAFLHLDAADMIGHSLKPNSLEYRDLVRHLDALLAEVFHEVERVSAGLDVRITFILTADHGMTDWGSHGAGSLHETTTPLLAWGAGIRGPETILQSSAFLPGTDAYGIPLHNHGRVRREINQADLCPLMASLLGVPIPTNSVGRVPLSLLAVNQSVKAQLVRANCLHLAAQLHIKRKQVLASHFTIFFREFRRLSEMELHKQLREADLLLSNSMYNEAIEKYELLSDLVLASLDYYHRYDRAFLSFCIGATFLLWILIILCSAIGSPGLHFESHSQYRAVSLVLVIVVIFVLAGRSTINHLVYQVLPLLMFAHLFCSSTNRARLINLFRTLLSMNQDESFSYHTLISAMRHAAVENAVLGISSLLLLELLMLGFSRRPLLSLACLLLASWPFLDRSFGSAHQGLRRLWSSACITLSVFPQLPLVGAFFNPFFVCLSGLFVIPVSFVYLHWLSGSSSYLTVRHTNSMNHSFQSLGIFLLFMLGLSCCLVGVIHSEWGFLPPVKFLICFLGWSMLILLPIVVILWCPPRLGMRIFCWFSVLLTLNILLSTGYEPIFFTVFGTVGLLWIQLETQGLKSSFIWSRNTTSSEPLQNVCLDLQNQSAFRRNFRQSLFFVFLLVFSFFGTGNIASVNSFDPRSTFVFVSRLKPATMAPFLLIKVLCPMLCLGVIYGAVQLNNDHFVQSRLYESSVVTQTALCTAISNFIAMHFFFWLRDEGSWLDIGTSISHYVIAMAIGLIAFLFGFLGRHMLICCWHSRRIVGTTRKLV